MWAPPGMKTNDGNDCWGSSGVASVYCLDQCLFSVWLGCCLTRSSILHLAGGWAWFSSNLLSLSHSTAWEGWGKDRPGGTIKAACVWGEIRTKCITLIIHSLSCFLQNHIFYENIKRKSSFFIHWSPQLLTIDYESTSRWKTEDKFSLESQQLVTSKMGINITLHYCMCSELTRGAWIHIYFQQNNKITLLGGEIMGFTI